ncbi:hypothetical protein BKA70DRAFT_1417707 [Coprinopsis sp. MPI-PUGE-AT-0042]|nr:hypothetical protein BKA70DRAFT_1417707 [Coprinopsis sp. MPI-PUGE-AT-0042]
MVSALWKACSDGDLEQVRALLAEATPIDVEIKDHTGSTPLIEAVKNGHVEVVRALLDKGADPQNASSQGRPDQYTTDPAILELLNTVQANFSAPNFPQNHHMNEFAHPPPPPGAYPYYPHMNPGMPGMGEGVFYPPTSPHGENGAAPGIHPHLPPPELARMIPCKYWPACRFGPRCMFLHPAAPYYPGANMPPPGQYPMFDPAMGPYGYYPPPPPPPHFQPNGAPMAPLSPHGHHARSPSEVPQYPAGGPVPPAQFVPVSPSAYPPPPGPMSGPPMPPMHHQPLPQAGPHSPTAVYHPAHPIQPYPGPDPAAQYMPPPPTGNNYPEPDAAKVNGQQDGAFPPQSGHHRDGSVHRRGGGIAGRRSSFAKKPACLFFPAGRCKNGDDCRFPHVLESTPVPNHIPPFYVPRGPPRPPRNNHHGGPSLSNLEQKMANMAVRDETPSVQTNGVNDQQPQVAQPQQVQQQPLKPDFGNRPRYQGPKQYAHAPQHGRRPGPASRVQRVPSADDFPVLPGSATPPRVNGVNGNSGPTAADILRAPAPARSKDASEDGTNTTSTRGPSPDSSRARTPEAIIEPMKATPAPIAAEQPAHPSAPVAAPQKLPVSFAAAAANAAASNPPESAPRVAVSA